MKKSKTEVTALLTIPAKVEAAAVPKPSRKEVIELAAHRLLKREQEAYAAEMAKLKDERKAIRATILKVCLDNIDKALAKADLEDALYLALPWRTSGKPTKFEDVDLKLEFQDMISTPLVHRYYANENAINECQRKYRWLDTSYRQDNGLFKEAVRRVKELMDSVPSEGHRMPTFLADAELCKAIDSFITKLETAKEAKALKAGAAESITVS